MIKNLVIVWDFDPVMFSLGSLEIRYYGLMWALALLLGGWFFGNFCKREGLKSELADSIFIYGALATVIGARLGHCLFYEPGYYLSQPWTIITEIRNGGMASHGAAIGLLIGLWLFSRKNKMPYIWSLDRIMIPVGIGGAIVRLGNLFNSEIIGCATDVPWAFKFVRLFPAGTPVEAIPAQHPTQLYEALCYFVTFLLLAYLYYAKDLGRRRPGLLFGIGLQGIFLTRFCIEFIKLEQEAFEKGMILDMGQILSIPFILLGFYIIWRALAKPAVGVGNDAKATSTPKAEKSNKKRKIKW
ncbi:MAG: prolipoprotein diacylglyceryl transferase [Alistipes sp.]|nr:prolipoprotein diacylglyceryl transferase [Alistipes sp.]